ncbi:DUF2059 domain-containing protein [Alteriqipengyuania sp. WL0013]|uniref:DUF2059 domain-containing protein n=1 Tax=Alteriqipengyuania sp. WL0013 TaxID=3110773 RepID=UPI002BDD5E4A|nr:DUF2059 domain-containing protein [Alteriqipengyuania sp. WL0013]MEB3416836.1 DUF2059 domain-containing protein [Alteriqipengyuania sp. WL0013]
MRDMKTILAGLAALALAPVALATSPAAQAQEAQADVYVGLYDAMGSAVDMEVTVDTTVAGFIDAMRQMPFGERPSEAMWKELAVVMRPLFLEYGERGQAVIKPEMIAMLRSGLTEEEATYLTEFYLSPLGQKVQRGIGESYDAKSVIGDAVDSALTGEDGPAIGRAAVEADITRATMRSLATLTAEEQAELARVSSTGTAFQSLAALQPKMVEIRTRGENLPMTPDEERRMEAAMTRVFEKYLKR